MRCYFSHCKRKKCFQTNMISTDVTSTWLASALCALYNGVITSFLNLFRGRFKTYFIIGTGSSLLFAKCKADCMAGTSVIVAPWDSIPGSEEYGGGYYSYPCTSTPSIAISFGPEGQDWSLDPAQLNLGALGGSDRCHAGRVTRLARSTLCLDIKMHGYRFSSPRPSHLPLPRDTRTRATEDMSENEALHSQMSQKSKNHKTASTRSVLRRP